jgi:hypothetical protein
VSPTGKLMTQRTAAPEVGQPLNRFSKLLVLGRFLANLNNLLVFVITAIITNGVRYAFLAAVRAINQMRSNQRLVGPSLALDRTTNFLFG